MREIPEGMTHEDRMSFEAIAMRAANEAVNCYTILSLGAQAYQEVRKFPIALPDAKGETPAPVEPES